MVRTTSLIALTMLALSNLARAEDVTIYPDSYVLVVLAHPDDELVMAPAIASLARQGAQVTLAYATNGDAGPGVSDFDPGLALGSVRLNEAGCAGDALGVATVESFHHGDGQLAVNADKEDSTAKRLGEDVASFLTGMELVLTWGPDGGYGHPDHRMVSKIVTQVIQAMPAAERPGLLYVGIPAGSLPPAPEMAAWATTDPALLTQTISYTSTDLEAAKAAAACHVTQFDEATRQGMMGLFDSTMWQGKVHFRPAF